MGNPEIETEELEARVARLEALFSVLLLAGSDDVHPGVIEDVLRFFRRGPPFPGPWIEELFMNIRRRPRRRVSELETRLEGLAREVSAVRDANGEASVSLHTWLALGQLGADLDEIPMERIVPIRVYLKEDTRQPVTDAITKAASDFAETIGLAIADRLPVVRGSWFGRFFAKTKETATLPAVQERLAKGERALELAALQKPQAAADKDQAEAAACLIKSVDTVNNVVMQVGSILLVKNTDSSGKSSLVVQTLSQAQMIHLEKNPQLLTSPDTILAQLRLGDEAAARPSLRSAE